MQEKYVILKKSEQGTIGQLVIEDNMAWINLNPNLNEKVIPLHFRNSYHKNIYRIDNKQVDKWIKTRIPPQYRQDISEVLQSLGLKEYDEYQIFKAYKGKSVRDDYYIEKAD